MHTHANLSPQLMKSSHTKVCDTKAFTIKLLLSAKFGNTAYTVLVPTTDKCM